MARGPWRRAFWLSALEAFGIAFIVTFALYAFKVMGGGDCKLFTAAALFAGMEHLLALALATALTGAAIVLGRAALNPTRALVMLGMKGKGDFSVPYGVAIAVGTLAVVWGGLFNRIPQGF